MGLFDSISLSALAGMICDGGGLFGSTPATAFCSESRRIVCGGKESKISPTMRGDGRMRSGCAA